MRFVLAIFGVMAALASAIATEPDFSPVTDKLALGKRVGFYQLLLVPYLTERQGKACPSIHCQEQCRAQGFICQCQAYDTGSKGCGCSSVTFRL